jgi:hypothetical protein
MSTKKPLSPFVSVKANGDNQNSYGTTKLAAKSSSVSVRAERIASLYAFYQVHRPEKAKDAAGIYKSHEYEQLCARLRSQYGGLPEGWGSSSRSSSSGGGASFSGTTTSSISRRMNSKFSQKKSSDHPESAGTGTSVGKGKDDLDPEVPSEAAAQATQAGPTRSAPATEPTPAQLAMRNFRSGEQFLKSGQYSKAEAKYTTALSQKPGMMSALHSR